MKLRLGLTGLIIVLPMFALTLVVGSQTQQVVNASPVQVQGGRNQNPIEQQIANAYQVQIQGMRDKNIDQSLFGISPNLVAQLPNGQTISYEQVKKGLLNAFQNNHQIQTQVDIQQTQVQGQTAIVSLTVKSRGDLWVDNAHTVVLPLVIQSSAKDTWLNVGGSWQQVKNHTLQQKTIALDPEGANRKLSPQEVQAYKTGIHQAIASGTVNALVNQFNTLNLMKTMITPNQSWPVMGY